MQCDDRDRTDRTKHNSASAVRSAWGPVNVYCFNFIVQAQAYLPHARANTRKMLLRWTIALPYLLRSHLLNYKPGSDSLEELLTANEVRSSSCKTECTHRCANAQGVCRLLYS
jgi:hypothetical protein